MPVRKNSIVLVERKLVSSGAIGHDAGRLTEIRNLNIPGGVWVDIRVEIKKSAGAGQSPSVGLIVNDGVLLSTQAVGGIFGAEDEEQTGWIQFGFMVPSRDFPMHSRISIPYTYYVAGETGAGVEQAGFQDVVNTLTAPLRQIQIASNAVASPLIVSTANLTLTAQGL